MAAKFFCFKNDLGYVIKGVFYAVEDFDEVRFRKIIKDIIGRKKFYSADLLLKEVIKQYLGLKEQQRTYKKIGITDSEFYLFWRKVILEDEDFKISSVEVKEKSKEIYRRANKQRRAERNYGSFSEAKDNSCPIFLKRHPKWVPFSIE